MIIDIHEAGDGPGTEHGTRPTKIAESIACPDCGKVHDIEACPKCGSDIILGYGLGFGPGMGEYNFCENRSCDWRWKREDADE